MKRGKTTGGRSRKQRRRSDERRRLSRRGFLGTCAGGAVALQVGSAAARAGVPRALRYAEAPAILTGGVPTYDPDLVLLIDRITGGFSIDEYDHAVSLGGYEAYLDEQLNQYQSLVGPVNDPDLWNRLTPYDIVDKTEKEIFDTYAASMTFRARAQTSSIQVMFAVYARAQLYYRMMQFWNHHFNIDLDSNDQQAFLLWPFLRDVILANCMGNFGDMMLASAQKSSMLLYLNNYTNFAGSPDENYAREAMELHTLGVDNGYDEEDVNEVARILTGWSSCYNGLNGCSQGTVEYGTFWFRDNKHDTGDKTVLGRLFPGQSGPAGVNEGIDLFAFLTSHANTAEYISRKMCRFFLGGSGFNYNPPEDVVQMVKWTYLNNPVAVGDISSMLAVILDRQVLTQYGQPKFRRPFDLVSASLRAVQAEVDPGASSMTDLLRDLRSELGKMGMPIQEWAPPNGPVDSESWAEGGMLTRWQYLTALARDDHDEVNNFSIGSGTGLLAQVGANSVGMEAAGYDALLTGGRMTNKEKSAIQDHLAVHGSGEAALEDALAFAMSLPTYQFI